MTGRGAHEKMTKSKILIVDDDHKIVDLVRLYLERDGYRVFVAYDGLRALELARQKRPDLIVLDLLLPEVDGLDVCRILQNESSVPIIMLTAKTTEADKLIGLELGADDYVTKPFSVRELMARVKAVLRRITPVKHAGAAVYRVGSLEVDTVSREARLEGAPLPLTRLEFDLLETLARHAGQALSREQLLDQVWGYDYYGDARAVDSAIKRLRARLLEAGGDPSIISTVRGVGYRLERN